MTRPEHNSLLTADHLRRKACVYVRQSSEVQVRTHVERQKLQYALASRARELGFEAVEVVDDDQGSSGGGVQRPGFDRLLTAVCRGEVGLVLALEASRLARNGRDWHTLLDFCAIVGCLLGDSRRLYDPGLSEDRLYLGLQGSFSEAELALFRQRSLESRMALAQRGELFTTLPAGYEKIDRWHIEMTPDQRQREALGLLFGKLAEMRSVRQVHQWCLRDSVQMPVRHHGEGIVWKVPTETGLYSLFRNPLYAGAYAFGQRRQETVIENGRKRVRHGIRKAVEEWTVLLRERHAGYISWETYERNQAMIAANNTRVRGAPRAGRGLLAGLLRCGHCTRRMQVRDNGKTVGYHCRGARGNGGACQSFGAHRTDTVVSAAVLEGLRPLGVEAALQAWAGRGGLTEAEERLARASLEEARYRAERAQAQFEAVEPQNRNVLDNVARKWEECLREVRECEQRLEGLAAKGRETELGPEAREGYLALGADLERAWNHERATPELRKAVLRAALVEITASTQDERVRLLLHWKGGDHTELEVERKRSGQHRWSTDAGTLELVRELARSLSDDQIAALLNRLGRRTAKDNSWNKDRVRSLRNSHGIAVYRQGERAERGELVMVEAAERLGVDVAVVRRLIRTQILPARQACKGAPWLIAEQDLRSERVEAGLSGRREPDPGQLALELSGSSSAGSGESR